MRPWMLIETTCVTEFEYYFGGERITFSVGAVEISTPQKKQSTRHVLYISPYCRLALVPPNFMKFAIQGQLTDVITCVKFVVNRFRRLQSSDTRKLHFPIDLLRRPYNSHVTL